MNDDVHEYCGELVGDLDIGRGPEEYKVFLLTRQFEPSGWIIKLNFEGQTFLVTKNIQGLDDPHELTRRTFFEYLKNYNKPGYHVWFERNHQQFVGHLLDALVYTFKQGDKISSIGPLDTSLYEQQLTASLKNLEDKLRK